MSNNTTIANLGGANGLAASGGSALVGHNIGLTGSETIPVSSKLFAAANLFDWIPASQHNAILAGTSTYDATSDFQDALNQCGTYFRNFIDGDPNKSDGVRAALELPRGLINHGALVIPEGVAIRGQGWNATVLKYNGGAGIAIKCGGPTREHSGIYLQGLSIIGDGATAGTEGVRFERAIRGCGLNRVQISGFAKNLVAKDSYECHIDQNFIHSALVNNMHWHGATAQVFRFNRFDEAGAENIIIDGQSSAGLSDIEPIGVHFYGGAIQRAQTNGIKIIDGVAVNIEAVFFEGNNADGTSNPHILALQGAMTRTMRSMQVDKCQFFKGSAAGTNHRAMDIRTTEDFSSTGCFLRDAGFSKGFVLASTVNKAYIRGDFSGAATPVDATSTTNIDYLQTNGDKILGDGGRTAGAFVDLKRSKPNGFLHNMWNSSSTSGSVTLNLRTGTDDGTTFAEYHTNNSGSLIGSLNGLGEKNVKTSYAVNGTKVVGARGASLPANATDLATAIALVNAIKDRLKTTGGHGLVAD